MSVIWIFYIFYVINHDNCDTRFSYLVDINLFDDIRVLENLIFQIQIVVTDVICML